MVIVGGWSGGGKKPGRAVFSSSWMSDVTDIAAIFNFNGSGRLGRERNLY